MARYEKYHSTVSGFRAPVAANVPEANWDVVLGASLNATGQVVTGGPGNSGFVGVVVMDRTKRRAGDIQDVMVRGEIVEVTGTVAGTTYYLDAAGALTATAPAVGVNGYKVGHTVEADRLVVDFQRVQG